MENDRSKLEQIFNMALEIESPRERDAYLDRACAGDPDLRARVEALLFSHFEAGSFLEVPLLDSQAETLEGAAREVPGTRIGRYRLLQIIGEGGFGIVYMAEQEEPVRRKVALKIIKLGMDTKQVVARFEAERQALAVMDHPNIARVLDAGTTSQGRPYFVMELVKGVPITEYCDTNHLSTKERLELFIQVCRAVQHAHQKGIIHRDIKPTNVLVTLHDSTPVPKVIDFGIAKATSLRLTEKTLFTEFRQFVGTPEYMSPDQAAISGLDVDTRTDIYSLGVLLYELLTGSTPFDAKTLRSASYDEIARIIREVEPPRPSVRVSTLMHDGIDIATLRHAEPEQLSRLMRGDLDWIVMKAMEKDRVRRYETASELAVDVQRFLNNEPVLASPPRLAYRVRKFMTRHRVGVSAGATVLAALVVGLLFATYGLSQARQEAEHNRRVAAFLGDLFVSTAPNQAVASNLDVAGVAATARDLFGDDHATVAATLSSRALQLQSQGDLEGAERHYRESLGIWRQFEGDDGLNVAGVHRSLGLLQFTMGDHPAAEASFREALRIARALEKPNLTTAETLTYLADVLGNRGDYAGAIPLLEEAVTIRRTIAPEQRLQLALTTNSLTNDAVMAGRDSAVHALLRTNLEAWRAAIPGDGSMLAGILTQTSLWYLYHESPATAETLLTEAVDIYRKLPESPPQLHFAALQGLGRIYEQKDDPVALVPLALEAVTVGMRIEGKASPGCCSADGPAAEAQKKLNTSCWNIAKVPDRPREAYEVALDGVERYLAWNEDAPWAINTLGAVEYRLGRYAKALEALARSDAHYSQEPAGGTPQDVAFIAMAHHRLGQEGPAQEAMRRLRALMNSPRFADCGECRDLLAEAGTVVEGND